MDKDTYWDFSCWFLRNYGEMILDPSYEAMQLAAYHAWVSSRLEQKLKQERLDSHCDDRR